MRYDPNSTPTVTSWSSLNSFSTNLLRTQDLPIPKDISYACECLPTWISYDDEFKHGIVIRQGLISDDLLVQAFYLGKMIVLEVRPTLIGEASRSHISTFYHYIIKLFVIIIFILISHRFLPTFKYTLLLCIHLHQVNPSETPLSKHRRIRVSLLYRVFKPLRSDIMVVVTGLFQWEQGPQSIIVNSWYALGQTSRAMNNWMVLH